MSKSRVTKNTQESKSNEALNGELSDKFLKYIDIYLSSYTRFPENMHPEFEVRFGTKKIKDINKVEFYNIINDNDDSVLFPNDYIYSGSIIHKPR